MSYHVICMNVTLKDYSQEDKNNIVTFIYNHFTLQNAHVNKDSSASFLLPL